MTTHTFGPGRFQSESQRMYDALHPDPVALNLRDISISLGNICRFGGHIRTFYSVADHSRFVARILAVRGEPPVVQHAGLVHDVVEVVTGDVIGPMKPVYGESLKRVEDLWTPVVEKWFDLPIGSTTTPAVKSADLTAYYIEVEQLRGWRAEGATYTPVEYALWGKPEAPSHSGYNWYDAVERLRKKMR
jgi:hypothetical protein